MFRFGLTFQLYMFRFGFTLESNYDAYGFRVIFSTLHLHKHDNNNKDGDGDDDNSNTASIVASTLLYASSTMSVAAAVPRSAARLALSSRNSISSRTLLARQGVRGLASAFKPTPGARKSAVGIETHDADWDARYENPSQKIDPTCIVNSHTEWDPLEEVIVGRVDDATIPEWHVSGKAVWPAKHWDMYKNNAGQSFPKDLMHRGESQSVIVKGYNHPASLCRTRRLLPSAVAVRCCWFCDVRVYIQRAQ